MSRISGKIRKDMASSPSSGDTCMRCARADQGEIEVLPSPFCRSLFKRARTLIEKIYCKLMYTSTSIERCHSVITGHAEITCSSNLLERAYQSLVMHQTCNQHKAMEYLMACTNKVETIRKPTFRNLPQVSHHRRIHLRSKDHPQTLDA